MAETAGFDYPRAMSGFTRREWIRGAGSGLAAYALSRPVLARPLLAQGDRVRIASSPVRMAVVPAGVFLMGSTLQEVQLLSAAYGYEPSWFEGELPQRQVDLPAFAIDRYPVTHAQFAAFCLATGHPPRQNWPSGLPPAELHDHPVNFVSQADALAYAAWVGMRLPTEEEWEKAARGIDGRRFPWGNSFDPDACRWGGDPGPGGFGTVPVTAHPRGVSPFGVQDMVGNLAEWCADGPASFSAYIKGGAWTSCEVMNLRPAARNMSGASNNPSGFYGFRCVKDLP